MYQNLMASECKLVGSYLRGKCLAWYDNLTPDSLRDYRDFSRALLIRFFGKKKQGKNYVEFMATFQEEKEDVIEWFHRHLDEAMAVPEIACNPRQIICSYINGLRDDTLYKELMKSVSNTILDLQKAVELYCVVECKDSKRKEIRDPNFRKLGAERRREATVSQRRDRPYHVPSATDSPRTRFEHFTPLNRSRSEIFHINKHMFPEPLPIKGTPHPATSDLWCSYHQDNGHSTENCPSLRSEIEKIIQRGQFRNYVDRPNGPKPPPATENRAEGGRRRPREQRGGRNVPERRNEARRDPPAAGSVVQGGLNPPPARMINVIYGVVGEHTPSNAALKASSR